MSILTNKVALFLPSLRGGGAERVMLNLARGFSEKGLEVDLVLAKAEGPYLSQVPPEVRVIDLHSSRVLASLPHLVRYLRRERPQALLSTLNHANIVALWAKRLAGVPTRVVVREANVITVSSANTQNSRGRIMPFLIRCFYPWADAVIAVSKGVADDLIKSARLPVEKIHVIYNPVVTPDLFTKAEEPLDHPWFALGEPPIILGVGRLTKQKDFATLINAFCLLRKEQAARLMILGEGEDRSALEDLIKKLDLQEDVSLPGFVDNPFKYMKRAAVFVLSSRWEGLPNTLIQAMALGTPVVSTDCPSGPAEILEAGKLGKLVPVGDVEALAEAIARKISSPMQKSRLDVCERFRMDKVIAQYIYILTEVVNG